MRSLPWFILALCLLNVQVTFGSEDDDWDDGGEFDWDSMTSEVKTKLNEVAGIDDNDWGDYGGADDWDDDTEDEPWTDPLADFGIDMDNKTKETFDSLKNTAPNAGIKRNKKILDTIDDTVNAVKDELNEVKPDLGTYSTNNFDKVDNQENICIYADTTKCAAGDNGALKEQIKLEQAENIINKKQKTKKCIDDLKLDGADYISDCEAKNICYDANAQVDCIIQFCKSNKDIWQTAYKLGSEDECDAFCEEHRLTIEIGGDPLASAPTYDESDDDTDWANDDFGWGDDPEGTTVAGQTKDPWATTEPTPMDPMYIGDGCSPQCDVVGDNFSPPTVESINEHGELEICTGTVKFNDECTRSPQNPLYEAPAATKPPLVNEPPTPEPVTLGQPVVPVKPNLGKPNGKCNQADFVGRPECLESQPQLLQCCFESKDSAHITADYKSSLEMLSKLCGKKTADACDPCKPETLYTWSERTIGEGSLAVTVKVIEQSFTEYSVLCEIEEDKELSGSLKMFNKIQNMPIVSRESKCEKKEEDYTDAEKDLLCQDTFENTLKDKLGVEYQVYNWLRNTAISPEDVMNPKYFQQLEELSPGDEELKKLTRTMGIKMKTTQEVAEIQNHGLTEDKVNEMYEGHIRLQLLKMDVASLTKQASFGRKLRSGFSLIRDQYDDVIWTMAMKMHANKLELANSAVTVRDVVRDYERIARAHDTMEIQFTAISIAATMRKQKKHIRTMNINAREIAVKSGELVQLTKKVQTFVQNVQTAEVRQVQGAKQREAFARLRADNTKRSKRQEALKIQEVKYKTATHRISQKEKELQEIFMKMNTHLQDMVTTYETAKANALEAKDLAHTQLKEKESSVKAKVKKRQDFLKAQIAVVDGNIASSEAKSVETHTKCKTSLQQEVVDLEEKIAKKRAAMVKAIEAMTKSKNDKRDKAQGVLDRATNQIGTIKLDLDKKDDNNIERLTLLTDDKKYKTMQDAYNKEQQGIYRANAVAQRSLHKTLMAAYHSSGTNTRYCIHGNPCECWGNVWRKDDQKRLQANAANEAAVAHEQNAKLQHINIVKRDKFVSDKKQMGVVKGNKLQRDYDFRNKEYSKIDSVAAENYKKAKKRLAQLDNKDADFTNYDKLKQKVADGEYEELHLEDLVSANTSMHNLLKQLKPLLGRNTHGMCLDQDNPEDSIQTLVAKYYNTQASILDNYKLKQKHQTDLLNVYDDSSVQAATTELKEFEDRYNVKYSKHLEFKGNFYLTRDNKNVPEEMFKTLDKWQKDSDDLRKAQADLLKNQIETKMSMEEERRLLEVDRERMANEKDSTFKRLSHFTQLDQKFTQINNVVVVIKDIATEFRVWANKINNFFEHEIQSSVQKQSTSFKKTIKEELQRMGQLASSSPKVDVTKAYVRHVANAYVESIRQGLRLFHTVRGNVQVFSKNTRLIRNNINRIKNVNKKLASKVREIRRAGIIAMKKYINDVTEKTVKGNAQSMMNAEKSDAVNEVNQKNADKEAKLREECDFKSNCTQNTAQDLEALDESDKDFQRRYLEELEETKLFKTTLTDSMDKLWKLQYDEEKLAQLESIMDPKHMRLFKPASQAQLRKQIAAIRKYSEEQANNNVKARRRRRR